MDFLADPSPRSIPPTMDMRTIAGDSTRYGSMYSKPRSRIDSAPMREISGSNASQSRAEDATDRTAPMKMEFAARRDACPFSPLPSLKAMDVVEPVPIPTPTQAISP